MKTLHLREAKARFSALVEAAEKGEPTLVTKHGRAAAMLVPVAEGRRLYPADRPSFAGLLMSIPDDPETERDRSPGREAEL